MKQTHKEFCPIPSCPGRQEIILLQETSNTLQDINNNLNEELNKIKQLIDDGMVSIRDIIAEIFKGQDIKDAKLNEITDKIETAFDTRRVAEIISTNLSLRKALVSVQSDVMKYKAEVSNLKQEKEAVMSDLKAREERDLSLIKEINNAKNIGEQQIKVMRENGEKIRQQELQLKALKDFIEEARVEVSQLESRHTFQLRENHFNKRKVKKVITLSHSIKRLKQGTNNPFKRLLLRKPEAKAIKQYEQLKTLYLELNTAERQNVGIEFDKVSEIMEKP